MALQKRNARPEHSPAIERADLRTPTARVWQIGEDRYYTVVRMSTHCFGDDLQNVIDYRLRRDGSPYASPFPVKLSRAGEHIQIGGVDLQLLDFGVMTEGRWTAVLPVQLRNLKVTPRFAPYRYEPTYHASYLDGELAPGVAFHAAISAKGYGKELRFARAVQTHWFRKLDGVQFFGLRYKRDGQLTGWHMQPPRMFVRNRGGQATGFYREDGEYLYVLWARNELDRLLPGEWIVDPAITQESIIANEDDCYDDGSDVNLDGYTGRDYCGAAFGNVYSSGLRFQSIPIPADATGMNSSTIQVFREAFGGTPNITIYGDDVDDAVAWTAGATNNRPSGSGVTRTTANVVWNSSFGSNNTYVSTPGIATVVDEVIQRAGWASGNDIRFAFVGAGSGTNFISFNDFSNNSTTEEAVFDADYIAAAGGDYTLSLRHRPFNANLRR
jgi:hypothetical protein